MWIVGVWGMGNPANNNKILFLEKFGKPLEEFESFKKAVVNLSENSKRQYFDELPRYFVFLNQNPDQVILQRQQDLKVFSEYYEKQTLAYANFLKKKGVAGKTILCQTGRICGFFRNNHNRYALDLRGKLRISKARKNPKYSPSNEDVRAMLSVVDSARDGFIVVFMYHTGANPVDVAAFNVDDLPLKDWATFERSRSKTGEVWRGCVTPDVIVYLNQYLRIRQIIHSELLANGKSPSKKLLLGRQGPLGSQDISSILRNLICQAGLGDIKGFKPTSLRDAFEDALVDAEIYHKLKETLMGHVSDIEQHYGGLKRLADRIVEAMKKVYPLICVSDSNLNHSNSFGLSAEDLEVVHELVKDKEVFRELAKLMREKKIQVID